MSSECFKFTKPKPNKCLYWDERESNPKFSSTSFVKATHKMRNSSEPLLINFSIPLTTHKPNFIPNPINISAYFLTRINLPVNHSINRFVTVHHKKNSFYSHIISQILACISLFSCNFDCIQIKMQFANRCFSPIHVHEFRVASNVIKSNTRQ